MRRLTFDWLSEVELILFTTKLISEYIMLLIDDQPQISHIEIFVYVLISWCQGWFINIVLCWGIITSYFEISYYQKREKLWKSVPKYTPDCTEVMEFVHVDLHKGYILLDKFCNNFVNKTNPQSNLSGGYCIVDIVMLLRPIIYIWRKWFSDITQKSHFK